MLLLESRPSVDQRTLSKVYTRRRALLLGAGALLSMKLKDTQPEAFRKIGNYTADIFSHNADTLSKIEKSSGIPAIEMDVTQLSNGTLVVAHDETEYTQIPANLREYHNPTYVADRIRRLKAKPHIDVKNVINPDSFASFVLQESENGPLAISTPHHEFLWLLHKKGFNGQILFTLRDQEAVKQFLDQYTKKDFQDGNFGVSIRFTLFSKSVSEKLKDLGLYRLAWTPNTALGILEALQNGADGITSDEVRLLKQIGKNLPKSA